VKLLLIDGHYYVYRSFFAIQNLSNSRGEPTNAIYGFVKTVRKMIKDVQPDRAAVLWDVGLPKRRTELQPESRPTADNFTCGSALRSSSRDNSAWRWAKRRAVSPASIMWRCARSTI